jgi:hypothetical protein
MLKSEATIINKKFLLQILLHFEQLPPKVPNFVLCQRLAPLHELQQAPILDVLHYSHEALVSFNEVIHSDYIRMAHHLQKLLVKAFVLDFKIRHAQLLQNLACVDDSRVHILNFVNNRVLTYVNHA